MSEEFMITMGAFSPSLEEQLEPLIGTSSPDSEAKREKAKLFDGHRIAISRCKIHGFITPSQCDKAYGKLMKMIAKEFAK